MDDQELWQAFGGGSLPEKDWTHQAHLRVAWLYSERHGLDEAHVLMRVGIIRLNARHGLVETPARGYHETITRVWLAIVRALRKEVVVPTSTAFVTACADRLARDAPLRHYTRDRLMSLEARARFVDPDLLPLP